jgi:hypothetical protein
MTSTSNFLHRPEHTSEHPPHLPPSSFRLDNSLISTDLADFAARLQQLNDEKARLAASQNLLNQEYDRLMLEMSSGAFAF